VPAASIRNPIVGTGCFMAAVVIRNGPAFEREPRFHRTRVEGVRQPVLDPHGVLEHPGRREQRHLRQGFGVRPAREEIRIQVEEMVEVPVRDEDGVDVERIGVLLELGQRSRTRVDPQREAVVPDEIP